MSSSLEERLDRLEERLERIASLLEAQAPAVSPSSPVSFPTGIVRRAVTRAEHELVAAGVGSEDRIGDVLIRLGDPETLESLSRIVVLLPQLEYAFQALAAGPELLEEGAELLRKKLAESGSSSHDAQLRLEAALDAARALSEPRVLRTLTALVGSLTGSQAALQGIASGLGAVAATESPDAFRARIVEAVTSIAEPETLASLARIAALAPDLEYAVQGLAAGPALLEEGLAFAREELGRRGIDAFEVSRRTEAASLAVASLTRVDSLLALGTLGELLPDLSSAAEALGRASRARAAVEGREVLTARLTETVIRLSDPDVLESVVRVATLLPDIEYAVQALAAGPELLEEGLELLRADPAAQDTLKRAVKMLPQLLGTVERMNLDSLSRLLDVVGKKETGDALLRVLEVATKKDSLATIERLVAVSGKLDVDALAALAEISAKPEILASLKKLLALTPELERTLTALPTQQRTLGVLHEMNLAVANSAAHPEPVGLWGLLGALRETEVQRAAGFGVAVARSLGKQLPEIARMANGNGKQLPPRKE
jgi:uncharacterized protein YjgD (DUF1641 family)